MGSPSSTSQAAEAIDLRVDLSTVVTLIGSYATQRGFSVVPAVYTATSTQTITTAATVAIQGPPTTSGSAVITNPYALWIQSGNVLLAGNLAVSGSLTVSGVVPTSGSGVSGRIAYWSGASSLASDSQLTWDSANDRQIIGVTPDAGVTNTDAYIVSSNTSAKFIALGYGLSSSPLFMGRRARGTNTLPTGVKSSDILFELDGGGYDGTAWHGIQALVQMTAAEDWVNGSAYGTNIKWYLTQPAHTSTSQIIEMDYNLLTTFGGLALSPNATVGGQSSLNITAAADTALVSEINDLNFNLARTVVFTSGSGPSTQRAALFQAPTYNSVGGGKPTTITTAATVAISGAPATSGSLSITNPYALWIQAGNVLFAGNLAVTGTVAGSNLSGTNTGDQTLTSLGAVGGRGNGSANRLAYWSDSNTLTSDASLTFDTKTLTVTPVVVSAGTSALVVTGAADTALIAEVVDVNFNLNRTVIFTSGSGPTTQRAALFQAPTYNSVGGGKPTTITTAATLAVSGAPATSGSMTITNPYALWVQAGTTTLAGGLNVGTGSGANTGSIVMSGGLNLGGASGAASGQILAQTSGAGNLLTVTTYNSSNTAVSGIRFQTARGTSGSTTHTLSGDWIGYIGADGYQETTSAFGAHSPFIRIIANQDWTSTVQGTRMEFYAVANGGTTASLGLTIGDGAKIGFLGAAAAAAQTQGATLTNNVTAGGSANTLANFTSLTTYSTDAATIRNDIYQIGQTLKTVVDALRLFGLLT